VLVTDRLTLRPFTAADADALVALDSDPEVMRYITGGLPTPRAEIVDDVLPAFLAWHQRSDHLGFFAAETGRTFIGWFHLRPADGAPDDEPEIGWRLRRSAWGHGFATEGARALIDLGFARHDLRRVVAQCMAVHTASRRVMEKLGMSLVREFHADWPVRIDGDEHGDVEYAIDREAWLRRRSL
jgi:RimJ/RimL family protein N-acetyltransferase